MDNAELINSILENQGLKPEQIADIMAEISEIDMGALDPTTPPSMPMPMLLSAEIEGKMYEEKDWRRRAALAAKLISLSLD